MRGPRCRRADPRERCRARPRPSRAAAAGRRQGLEGQRPSSKPSISSISGDEHGAACPRASTRAASVWPGQARRACRAGIQARRAHPFLAGIRQGDQMAGEVAAVDGRDIGRPRAARSARPVPVEEMALVAGHGLHRPNVASSRSTVSSVPVQPKSWAATVERR